MPNPTQVNKLDPCLSLTPQNAANKRTSWPQRPGKLADARKWVSSQSCSNAHQEGADVVQCQHWGRAARSTMKPSCHLLHAVTQTCLLFAPPHSCTCPSFRNVSLESSGHQIQTTLTAYRMQNIKHQHGASLVLFFLFIFILPGDD